MYYRDNSIVQLRHRHLFEEQFKNPCSERALVSNNEQHSKFYVLQFRTQISLLKLNS